MWHELLNNAFFNIWTPAVRNLQNVNFKPHPKFGHVQLQSFHVMVSFPMFFLQREQRYVSYHHSWFYGICGIHGIIWWGARWDFPNTVFFKIRYSQDLHTYRKISQYGILKLRKAYRQYRILLHISTKSHGSATGLWWPGTSVDPVANCSKCDQKLTPWGSITKGQELTPKSDLGKHAATVANKQEQ